MRLTVTIILLCCYKGLGTLVVDLNEPSNEEKNTYLALGQGIEINNPLTLCLRFNIKDAFVTNYVFSTEDEELVFLLSFSYRFGLVLINSVNLVFEIPKNNDLSPFHWHHICISSSKDSYIVVIDGQQWYHASHTAGSSEKTIVKRLDFGFTSEYWVYSDGINFKGLLSELNVWSKSLSLSQMVKITTNCGKVDPIPDILNWSELDESVIRGSKYVEKMGNICPQGNATSPIYKIMPYIYDRENAIQACKILNGEVAFPNSLNELQSWNGKLSRLKLKIIVNNRLPLIIIKTFCSTCIRICMSIFHGTNKKVIKWIMD